jgi:hypothetical protein
MNIVLSKSMQTVNKIIRENVERDTIIKDDVFLTVSCTICPPFYRNRLLCIYPAFFIIHMTQSASGRIHILYMKLRLVPSVSLLYIWSFLCQDVYRSRLRLVALYNSATHTTCMAVNCGFQTRSGQEKDYDNWYAKFCCSLRLCHMYNKERWVLILNFMHNIFIHGQFSICFQFNSQISIYFYIKLVLEW